ncbi:endonuclease/exonuclease/phosphatase family protein [Prevotella sp. 10(H)]|uniref:endonuclease/exonuclease/phosphatase family protein n=1 Tax=Prevotella sp. 10(H) TaxID=1158294 RepID=UPI0004A77A6F|nr:endonuclease/exonuclease/phosphatase family protein [Prevotella sp. 10(H)]
MPATSKLLGNKIGKVIKYTVFATNIIAILFLLSSLLAWNIVPSKMTIIAYLGLAFPIILFINIGYLILWTVFWRWKYALVQLVVILACWQPISTCFPVHFETSAKNLPENRIKVLTYNVRGFNWLRGDKARSNPMWEYITHSNADIICFQEFVVSETKGKNMIISESELNGIMKDYPYRSIIELGRPRKSKRSYKYGIACYSKFPITESLKVPIESTYNGSGLFTLEIQGRKVTLVVNHLESNRLTSEDKKLYKDFLKTRDRESFDEMANTLQTRLGAAYEIREAQANMIRAFMDKQEADATIVCGDFNDTPISYAYHTIKGDDLVDSYANSGFGQGITYHENYFLVRIDFILHSKAFESYNCTVDKVKFSDHYPVWTYLAFK